MSHPAHGRARRGVSVRTAIAAATAAALAVSGASVVDAGAASATPTTVAGALAQLLSGTATGVNGPLDPSTLQGLAPVGATFPAAPGPNLAPIGQNALSAGQGALSGGASLVGSSGIVQLGPVNQVAQAAADGSALSAVGAVTDAGALDLPGHGTPSTVDLTALLSRVPALSTGLSQLRVTLDGIAAQATQAAGGAQSGQYDITGGKLSFVSPVLGNIPQQVLTALAPLQSAVTGLGGTTASPGGLLTALNGIPVIGQILAGLTTLTQSATVTSNLQNSLGTLLSDPFSSPDGSVVLDPVTGLFTADLAQLAGGSLGGQLPNTSVLSPALLTSLVTQVTGLVQNLVSTIKSTLTAAIGNAPVHLSSIGGDGLLGLTGMNVDVQGTLAQVVAGTAPVTQTLTLLGLPVLSLSNLQLLTALAAPVNTLLGGGAFSTFSGALGSGLTTPSTGSLSTALNAITSLLGIDVNKQSTLNGVFTEVAMVLTLVPGNPLSVLNVGSASVGTTTPPSGIVTPTATALAPAAGPLAGGQTVTVTGTNFVAGLTTVSVAGTAVPANQVTVQSSTSLTFVTPAHAVGDVAVTVSNPLGSSAAKTYSYLPRPTLGALFPAAGSAGGGAQVTLTGSGFVAGGTTVRFASTAGTAVNVLSATLLTVRAPAHATGAVTVTVTTLGGTSTGATYTYRLVPVIVSLSSGSTSTGGGRTLTIGGGRFVSGQTEVLFGSTLLRATLVRVTSSTSLTVTTPARPAGSVTVRVLTPGGLSNGKGFRFVAGGAPVPSLRGLSVAQGSSAGAERVVVVGSGFVPGTTAVRVGSTTVPAGLVTVTSPTSLWFLTPAQRAGLSTVQVLSGRRVSAARSFRFVNPASVSATPTIRSPRSGYVTSNQGPMIGGTATPGAALTVLVDGVAFCRTTVVRSGWWSCGSAVPLLRGGHVVSAVQKAGTRAVSRESGRITLTEN